MDIFLGFITFVIVIMVWIFSARNGMLNVQPRTNDIFWDSDNSSRAYGARDYIPLSQKQSSRKIALQKAQLFLKPYNDLMGEHCLTKENVRLNGNRLEVIDKNKERKIICVNKIAKNSKRKIFTASINPEFRQYYLQPIDYVVDYLWDSICMGFDYSTVYENIASAATTAMLMVNESEIDAIAQNKTITTLKRENMLDLNKATEAEILALPGVNIVMAKKALKYIEKTGGFKSVDEFIQKLKIKDTFVEQIKAVTFVSQGEKIENIKLAETSVSQNEQPKTVQSNFVDNYSKNTKPNNDDNGNERIIDL